MKFNPTAQGKHLTCVTFVRNNSKTRRRVPATARNSTKETMSALWMAVAKRESLPIPHAYLESSHPPCSIARKSNFRKHLQGHRAYHPDIAFEDHWVRRDQPRPKRTGRKSRPSRNHVATKVDNPPAMSFKLEAHEERSGPIEVPQLYVTCMLRTAICLLSSCG